MTNNFPWSLEYISHADKTKKKSTATGKAHYSKNWNKQKQDAYNKEYYQENKWKWGVFDGSFETDKDGNLYNVRRGGKFKIGNISSLSKEERKKLEDHITKAQKDSEKKTGKELAQSYNDLQSELRSKFDKNGKPIKEAATKKKSTTAKKEDDDKKKSSKKGSGSSKKGSGSSKKSSSDSGSKSSGVKGGTGKSASSSSSSSSSKKSSSGSSSSGSSSKSSSGSGSSSKGSSSSKSSSSEKSSSKSSNSSAEAKVEPTTSAKYVEYSKDDSDFDSKNLTKDNKMGDTDFYGFIGSNGKPVIVEEDMKWEVPDNKSIDSDMKNNLKTLDDLLDEKNKKGEKYGNGTFIKAVSLAINGDMDGVKKLLNKEDKQENKNSEATSIKHSDELDIQTCKIGSRYIDYLAHEDITMNDWYWNLDTKKKRFFNSSEY